MYFLVIGNIDLLCSAKAINKTIALKLDNQKTIYDVTQLHFNKENDTSIQFNGLLMSNQSINSCFAFLHYNYTTIVIL